MAVATTHELDQYTLDEEVTNQWGVTLPAGTLVHAQTSRRDTVQTLVVPIGHALWSGKAALVSKSILTLVKRG